MNTNPLTLCQRVWQQLITGSSFLLLLIGFSYHALFAQNFAAIQENPFGIAWSSGYNIYNTAPAFADLDGDGDLDLLTGDASGKFHYFENEGTASNPQFSTYVANLFGLSWGTGYNIFNTAPAFIDLDQDGDLDLLTGDASGKFHYFKNEGTASNPQFAAYVANPFGLSWGTGYNIYNTAPAFIDLDQDGDLDLLTGDASGKFHYFENEGTASNPQFAAYVANPFGISWPSGYNIYNTAPAFADLDQDGDQDLITGDASGKFHYFENEGTASNPQFSEMVKDFFGIFDPSGYFNTIPSIADIDGDGDSDLMAGDAAGNFLLLKNESITGIDPAENPIALVVFPNPSNGQIHLQTPLRIESMILMDMSGKTIIGTTGKTLDLSDQQVGVYLLKVFTEKGMRIQKIVLNTSR